MMKIILVVIGLLFLASCAGTKKPDDISPVKSFDSQRYLGTWYEVARLENRFERGLSHVTAQYSLRDDGGIKVINKGYSKKDGEWNEVEGKAYFVEDEHTGFLKVSFWGPFYSAYVVFELDKDYQYSLVTGEDKSYLWILSRQRDIKPELLNELIAKAQALGFDTTKLIKTDHSVMSDQQLTQQ